MMNRNIGSIGECKDLIARFETNEFYVGEEIECLIHTRDKSNMYVPGNVDKISVAVFGLVCKLMAM